MVAEEARLVAKLRRERNGEESEYDKGVGVGGWGSLFTPRVDTGPLAPAVLRTVAHSPSLSQSRSESSHLRFSQNNKILW